MDDAPHMKDNAAQYQIPGIAEDRPPVRSSGEASTPGHSLLSVFEFEGVCCSALTAEAARQHYEEIWGRAVSLDDLRELDGAELDSRLEIYGDENSNESALTFRQSLDKRVREGTLEADLIWDGFHMHPCRAS